MSEFKAWKDCGACGGTGLSDNRDECDSPDQCQTCEAHFAAMSGYESCNRARQAAEAEAERLEAELLTVKNEINCRIEHGADSNGHLEGLRDLFFKDGDA